MVLSTSAHWSLPSHPQAPRLPGHSPLSTLLDSVISVTALLSILPSHLTKEEGVSKPLADGLNEAEVIFGSEPEGQEGNTQVQSTGLGARPDPVSDLCPPSLHVSYWGSTLLGSTCLASWLSSLICPPLLTALHWGLLMCSWSSFLQSLQPLLQNEVPSSPSDCVS